MKANIFFIREITFIKCDRPHSICWSIVVVVAQWIKIKFFM